MLAFGTCYIRCFSLSTNVKTISDVLPVQGNMNVSFSSREDSVEAGHEGKVKSFYRNRKI